MLEDLRQNRIEKLNNLAQAGLEVYPEKSRKDYSNEFVLKNFQKLSVRQPAEGIFLAGRVRSSRQMGALIFFHIEDESDKIQVLIKKDVIGDKLFDLFVNNIDIGDFIQVSGVLFETKTAEKTLEAKEWKILAKAILPIPAEFYGLKNKEDLLRRRYLDLIVNSETKELFKKKSVFWNTIRNFLSKQNFLEVDTPALEAIPGGADAKPFITRHNVLKRDFYLRISLELALKRLLVGGYEKVYEIGRVFRNEGIDAEHLQDYLAMEFYWAYADMNQGMKLVEKMYKKIVKDVVGSDKTIYDNNEINWSAKWPKVDYFKIFKQEIGINLTKAKIENLKAKADELGIKYEPSFGKGRLIDLIFKKAIRPKLIQPCFLVGHPTEVSPLAKKDPKNPEKVLRFQPIAGGSELGNGFAELNDPIDQRKRFDEQTKLRQAGDEEAQMIDEDFVEALEYGMPPAVGFGLSERLFAFIMDKPVRETTLFPMMKAENE